jgi:hypothetical protein
MKKVLVLSVLVVCFVFNVVSFADSYTALDGRADIIPHSTYCGVAQPLTYNEFKMVFDEEQTKHVSEERFRQWHKRLYDLEIQGKQEEVSQLWDEIFIELGFEDNSNNEYSEEPTTYKEWIEWLELTDVEHLDHKKIEAKFNRAVALDKAFEENPEAYFDEKFDYDEAGRLWNEIYVELGLMMGFEE